MINEKYIFKPNMELDIPRLKEIVFRNLKDISPELATHQRYAEKEPYLVELRNRYPFLSKLYNIYPSPPKQVIPIHICPGRGCALNIPIQYTEDSHTVFYESADNELTTTYDVPRIYNIVNSNMVEVYRYTLVEPVIMNTKLPHGVFGGPAMTRIILSWSITPEYEDTKALVGML